MSIEMLIFIGVIALSVITLSIGILTVALAWDEKVALNAATIWIIGVIAGFIALLFQL